MRRLSVGHGTSADVTDRLGFLEETLRLLAPGSRRVRSRSLRVTPGTGLVISGVGHPRLVVPAYPSRATAAALRRAGTPRTASQRLRAIGLTTVARSGAAALIFPDRVVPSGSGESSLLDYLSSVLNTRVLATMALTPRRANRKPVLALVDLEGHPVGFAKVGVDDLTRSLVSAEASNLARVAAADLRHVRAPEVIWHGPWEGLEVLVQSVVPAWRSGRATGPLLDSAMSEVAHGLSAEGGTMADYLADLGSRVDDIRDRITATTEQAVLTEVSTLVSGIDRAGAAGQLSFGCWHGDWSPWNCGQLDGRILLWDWERLTDLAPLGFDRLHFGMRTAIVAGQRHLEAARGLVEQAPQLLAPWSITADAARTTAALYLLDLTIRYLQDGQQAAVPGRPPISDWALPPASAVLRGAPPIEPEAWG